MAPVFRATGAATRGYRGAAVNAATAISRRLGHRGLPNRNGNRVVGPDGKAQLFDTATSIGPTRLPTSATTPTEHVRPTRPWTTSPDGTPATS